VLLQGYLGSYLGLKVLAADAQYIQFTARSRKMVVSSRHCGVREQLTVLKVCHHAKAHPSFRVAKASL
jgi:hypothetical protein